mmetsp:Transcript_51864/g.152968  ORF Transcript_51864/g.152968 Transcript_51864/m.152968 type:complete len:87 (-) Transcript_51864:154-414(-)
MRWEGRDAQTTAERCSSSHDVACVSPRTRPSQLWWWVRIRTQTDAALRAGSGRMQRSEGLGRAGSVVQLWMGVSGLLWLASGMNPW